MTYKFLTLCFILCSLHSCKNAEVKKDVEQRQQLNETAVEELKSKLDSIHQLGYFQGTAVAIVNENGVVFKQGYGYSDLKSQTSYTEHTIQNIASISKVVLGLTLMKAIEEGHISLEDDVNTYLDFKVRNPQFPDTPILVKHLTAHTSSIIDGDFYDYAYINIEPGATNNTEIDQDKLSNFKSVSEKLSLQGFLKKGLSITDASNPAYIYGKYAPGASYDYSNIGAALTAYIIQKAVGEDFKTYSKKGVIAPLSMQNTSWNVTDLDASKRSKLYSTMKLRYPEYDLVTFADGGLYTSVDDLGILLSELIKAHQGNGTLLNKKSYEVFFKKQLEESQFKSEKSIRDFKRGYNQGIFIAYERSSIGHSGGDPGVGTLMYFDPITHIGKITFKNTDFTSKEAFDSFVATDSILHAFGPKILNK